MSRVINYYKSQRSMDRQFADMYMETGHPINPHLAFRLEMYNREDATSGRFLGLFVTRVYEDFLTRYNIPRWRAFEFVARANLIGFIIESYDELCDKSSDYCNDYLRAYLERNGEIVDTSGGAFYGLEL